MAETQAVTCGIELNCCDNRKCHCFYLELSIVLSERGDFQSFNFTKPILTRALLKTLLLFQHVKFTLIIKKSLMS